MTHHPKLYIISPPHIEDDALFARHLAELFEVGGDYVGAFQLRLKQKGTAEAADRLTDRAASYERTSQMVDLLMPVCHHAGVALILNDDAALAHKLGVDGVHLGQEDGTVEQARALLGADKIIGATCHASRHLAMIAGEQGADYVAFGAFYPTTSKTQHALDHWGTPDTELLSWWVHYTTVPCVAIGGITPENAPALLETGVDMIAVISSLWHHKDGAAAGMRAFAQVLSTYEVA
ncbi:MAG: thiamine phosphate synthase [Alphaproteobacteria bacterium]|jgi:thiamine-phosphate pyrophosphorylase|nr:MAG: thiamine phosphate synthase [Alphaproteobacteria bacterium]